MSRTKPLHHDDDGVDRPSRVPMLRSVLPAGYDAAQADIDKIFEVAGREMRPDDPNLAYVPRLHEWLSTLLAAEYFGDKPEGPGEDATPGAG